MDPNRRLFLARAGSAGLATLLSPAAAPGCWPRRRRLRGPIPAGGYAVPAPRYAPSPGPTAVYDPMRGTVPNCYPQQNDLSIEGLYDGAGSPVQVVMAGYKYTMKIISGFVTDSRYACVVSYVYDLDTRRYWPVLPPNPSITSSEFPFTVQCPGGYHGGSGELIVTVSVTPTQAGCPKIPWAFQSTNIWPITYG
jgi:hypothetical protein